jgi:hypothetical protein
MSKAHAIQKTRVSLMQGTHGIIRSWFIGNSIHDKNTLHKII